MKPDNWWTPERVAELKLRWANRESGSIIAMAMHARSRNAVIGKLHRLGLRRNTELARVHGRDKRLRKTNGHKTIHYADFITTGISMGATQIVEPLPVFSNPKPFITLVDGECRFPGDGVVGPDLPCCAAPAIDGKPYCLAHCRIAYQRPGARPRP